MLSLQSHHITDLYCLIDDLLPSKDKPLGGRPSLLKDSELVTILVWNALTARQKTLKDIHCCMILYHQQDFPKLPKYKAFVNHCHRVIPDLISVLQMLLNQTEPLRLMDATMLPVCKLQRMDSHKVAKNIAKMGKNHQGWHYGFKLHASIDVKGKLCGLALTPANTHDAQAMPLILDKHTKIAVGDSLYGASVMRGMIWKNYGTVIITPPHYKQKRKVIATWQQALLSFRSKIESVFDYLKEHLHLVSSFPRSVNGYMLHYLRILLGYQVMVS